MILFFFVCFEYSLQMKTCNDTQMSGPSIISCYIIIVGRSTYNNYIFEGSPLLVSLNSVYATLPFFFYYLAKSYSTVLLISAEQLLANLSSIKLVFLS